MKEGVDERIGTSREGLGGRGYHWVVLCTELH